jgi:hypothetical protein
MIMGQIVETFIWIVLNVQDLLLLRVQEAVCLSVLTTLAELTGAPLSSNI